MWEKVLNNQGLRSEHSLYLLAQWVQPAEWDFAQGAVQGKVAWSSGAQTGHRASSPGWAGGQILHRWMQSSSSGSRALPGLHLGLQLPRSRMFCFPGCRSLKVNAWLLVRAEVMPFIC